VYCKRAKCFRCEFSRKLRCRFDMHNGKCWDKTSMLAAVGCRFEGKAEELSYVASGAVKDRDRWARIGERRSSSSRRGRARAVN
jgi:hypothetical protein